jgi:3-oxoacyl-[acyl-carrier-protein] synthase II
MLRGFVPATMNLEDPDPECDLEHVRMQSKAWDIDVALCTSFGFGSRNAALILRRFRDEDTHEFD